MNQIANIKSELVKDTYECDHCGKQGTQNDMIFIIGKGLFHAKCYKEILNKQK